MTHGFFATIFYIPLYNALVALINILPGYNVGLAVIVLTIIIRFVLYPLSRSSIRTQMKMKEVEKDLEIIKKKYPDRQEQARQTMALYKEKGVNPFSGILLLIIQLPILIALYQVFNNTFPKISADILYSFVSVPPAVIMNFLTIDLTSPSIISRILLALIAVGTQFIQINIAVPKMKKADVSSFGNDLAYNMNVQSRYILPLVLFPVAYLFPVICLYLIASNVFMIFQELYVRKTLRKTLTPVVN